MFIPLLSAVLDDAGLKGEERAICTRHLLRVLLKIVTYTEAKPDIKKAVGHDCERVLAQQVNNIAWNEPLQLHMWRAFHAYVHTHDEDVIQEYGMTRPDLYYIRDHLKTADISAVKYSNLDYTKKPITEDLVRKILKKTSVRGTVKHYASKLKFVTDIEPSFEICDFEGVLEAHAIMTIYRYEACRSIEHIVNSVNQALANYWRDECDTWNAMKRTGTGRIKIDTGKKKANGKKIYDFDNRCIRSPMFIEDENGASVENPELMSRSVEIEQDLLVRDFVNHVEQVSPRYGRYLRITVLDESDPKCEKWVSRHMELTKREEERGVEDEKFHEYVMRYCKVTERDTRKAVRVYREYTEAHNESK